MKGKICDYHRSFHSYTIHCKFSSKCPMALFQVLPHHLSSDGAAAGGPVPVPLPGVGGKKRGKYAYCCSALILNSAVRKPYHCKCHDCRKEHISAKTARFADNSDLTSHSHANISRRASLSILFRSFCEPVL